MMNGRVRWSIRVKTCQSRKSWKRFDCAVPQRLMAPECEFLGHPQCRTLARWLKMAEVVSRCLCQPVVEMPRLLLLASSGELHLVMHPCWAAPRTTRDHLVRVDFQSTRQRRVMLDFCLFYSELSDELRKRKGHRRTIGDSLSSTPMTSTSRDVMMNTTRFHSGGVQEACYCSAIVSKR